MLRAGAEKLTDRQWAPADRDRRRRATPSGVAGVVLRTAASRDLPAPQAGRGPQDRRAGPHIVSDLPVLEIARLGRTLKQWREALLPYFDTARSSNGGTEAVNGLIDLHRRVARGFRNRDNYRLRMLLIGGGLTSPTSSKKSH